MEREGSTKSEQWYCLSNESRPKAQVVFICQIILIYIIILTSVVNLSINNGDKTLWCTLLASCLGYILPNPSIKRSKPASVVV